MKLSPNFMLEEFTTSQEASRRGIDNSAPPEIVEELRKTAELLERVRQILCKPILITSGYRSPALNAAIPGSAKNSAHMYGKAADFVCPGFGSPVAVCRRLQVYADILDYDQLIYEFASWTHIGRAITGTSRRQDLTIDGNGTRFGISTS